MVQKQKDALFGSNHLHTYLGISALITTTALSGMGVPALYTTFPSTNTLPVNGNKSSVRSSQFTRSKSRCKNDCKILKKVKLNKRIFIET